MPSGGKNNLPGRFKVEPRLRPSLYPGPISWTRTGKSDPDNFRSSKFIMVTRNLDLGFALPV